MSTGKLCMIFEAIGPYNAIGKIAMAEVEAALAAGWEVSVVAKFLHESLHGRVEWLRLYVPPRGFALQWLTARWFIGRAIGDRSRFDVIHGHQPQIADWCDVFECHFLTRAAYDRSCLLDMHGARRILEWSQKRLVLAAEDRHFRRWNASTHMLFNSELTREWFARYYGMPPSEEVLLYPSPAWDPVAFAERAEARVEFGLPADGVIAGFLGGLHERKGYRRVIDALIGQRDITLLMGGLHSGDFKAPELAGHFKSLGVIRDTRRFYAACDVLLVPSQFEPFGYVISEAAARGVPAIAAADVGALPTMVEHGSGLKWTGDLSTLIRFIVGEAEMFAVGCRRYTDLLSRSRRDLRLAELYEPAARGRGTHAAFTNRRVAQLE